MQAQFLREVILAVENGVAHRGDIDRAFGLALNVSRGPLAEMDDIRGDLDLDDPRGDILLTILQTFADLFGKRFDPPNILKEMVRKKELFTSS